MTNIHKLSPKMLKESTPLPDLDVPTTSVVSSSSREAEKDWLRHPLGNCRPVQEYKKVNRIGEGTYGYVYRAIHRESQEVVALKRIILHHEQQDGFPLTSIREVKTLRRCRHHNIVQLLDIVVGPNRDAVFLLFEYCEHDLSNLIKHYKNPFKESEIKRLVFQLLSAVDYIHKNWIIHRDIKLSNLLYNSKGQLKLADFGLARTVSYPADDRMTQVVVTLWYRAPEILLGSSNYSFGVDLWSVGCILGELLLHGPLVDGDNELDQISKIFALLGSPNERIWPDVLKMPLIDNQTINLEREKRRNPYNNLKQKIPSLSEEGFELMNSLLTYNPALRLPAREALRHEYFYSSPYPKEEDFMPTFPTLHH